MNTSCDNVRSMIHSYLDGELSEAQAAPVRNHLLDCCSCRESAQEGKVIKRWFAADKAGEVIVPQGFASRVARRAFAGDPGYVVPAPARADGVGGAAASVLPFVLKVSALAAGLLFTFSLFIQKESLPQGSGLEAERRPFWEVAPDAGALDERAPARPADEGEEDEDDGEEEAE
jgi:anti-sigma factor RsiW